MGHVVVHKGEMGEAEYRQYLLLVSRWLLARGSSLDRVPRTAANGDAARWLYVFDDEASAKELVDELKQHTQDPGWEVAPVEGTVEEGPLRPITVEASWTATSIGIGLDPIMEEALQTRYPRQAKYWEIWLKLTQEGRQPAAEELRELTGQLLPVLTGLSPEQLGVYGGFEVVDPVTERVLVPFTPYPASPEGEAQVSVDTPC